MEVMVIVQYVKKDEKACIFIGTLDNCLIDWNFFSSVRALKKNYFNSVTNKHCVL